MDEKTRGERKEYVSHEFSRMPGGVLHGWICRVFLSNTNFSSLMFLFPNLFAPALRSSEKQRDVKTARS